jgi:tRNA pseudouridine13 synthase
VLAEVPAPRVGGRYKERIEDFEVEEVPSYEPSGDGTHTWLWIEKRGLSTLDAMKVLAGVVAANQRDFGYAGMKDAQAVTRQWVSVEHVDPARFEGVAADGVKVLRVDKHGNKLKPGHLTGNRFSILLRGAAASAADALRDNVAWCAEKGVPNYFGEQRFGKRGANLDQGLAILRSRKPKRKAYSYAPRILKLLLSAVQSEVFNRVLIARLASYDRLLDGDLAWIHANGASFTVQDLEAEQRRCAAFEVSPSGPLPGPKTLWAGGEAQKFEEQVMAEMELSAAAFAPFRSHPGGRRSLRLPVHEAEVTTENEGLRLRFRLPAGAYATSVLRQLLTDAPWPN